MPSLDGGLKKRVGSPLLPDGCRRSVSGVNTCIVAKRKQHGANRREQRLQIASRQVCSSNRAGEQRVADKQIFSGTAVFPNLKTDAARAMSGCVMRHGLEGAEANSLSWYIKRVHRRRGRDFHPE